MDKAIISILSGLGGMLGWGVSDFFANSASDSIGHKKAFLYSQIIGLVFLTALAAMFVKSYSLVTSLIPHLLITGIAYTLGYLFFYKAFEIGNVSVVSSVVNLQQIFIIGISFFIYKQSLTLIQVPAILMLLIGVTLVSVNFKDFIKKGISLVSGVKESALAAIMFGLFYWPINEYIVERSDWIASTLYIKIIAIITVFIIAYFQKSNLTLVPRKKNILLVLALVGILEAIAVLSIGFGGAYGDYIIVGPIAGSLTVVTVTLAMIFLKEKITKVQGLGIGMVIAGIILTAL